MSLFNGSVFSDALHMETSLGVMLPHDRAPARGSARKPRTLILLHGLSDNWAAWPFRTRILVYAESHGVAVIMPEVQRSFYQDMRFGEAYFTYVSEELPALAASMFNLSIAPEDLMVAGLSMGGYGALRCALTHPERYRAVGAFSSACRLTRRTERARQEDPWQLLPVAQGMFGEALEVPDTARIEWLAERAAGTKAGAKLPIMMTCGTEDGLYPENTEMVAIFRRLGLNVSFDVWPGVHEWGFWDKSVAMFLDRFAD